MNLSIFKTPYFFSRTHKFLQNYFEDSQKSLSNRFDFLDGYRGFCAIIVVLHHTASYIINVGDFKYFYLTGYFIGVFGFFVLSSFLLTYRMIKDFEKSRTFDELITIIIKYFIRRIFRIYVPYVIYVTLVKLLPSFFGGFYVDLYVTPYSTWTELVTLQAVGPNHLWTVPIEIKYYFVIPLVCIVFHYFKNNWHYLIAYSSVLTYIAYQTVFYYEAKDVYLPTANKLYPRFPVFFSGSLVAYLYFNYEKHSNDMLRKIMLLKPVKFILTLIPFFMALYAGKYYSVYLTPGTDMYKDSIHPGVEFSILLFIMLISAPSNFTRIFGDSFVLKMYGKYSFGVYLFHPTCILVKNFFESKQQCEFVPVILLTSLLAGYLFYFLIENPAMKLGNHFIKKL